MKDIIRNSTESQAFVTLNITRVAKFEIWLGSRFLLIGTLWWTRWEDQWWNVSRSAQKSGCIPSFQLQFGPAWAYCGYLGAVNQWMGSLALSLSFSLLPFSLILKVSKAKWKIRTKITTAINKKSENINITFFFLDKDFFCLDNCFNWLS